MNIIDEHGTIIENPDLTLGYLKDDPEIIHHDAVKAGLPNITGSTGRFVATSFDKAHDPDRANGALSYSGLDEYGDIYSSSGSYGRRYYIDFNASKSNAIYGRSSTVQPAAYYVHIWRRVA